ncbi:hypothetical protein CEXT_321661 [Caerostris extrusa]|uniref:Uncharacterized protein n=1 Tax=Caerostris extrusa TaxID=172846 RepID=A0AAV4XWH9_CAEEX|nr:hypothetical protein CEXT_321661 [Caerostris extrusa]
MKLQTTIGAYSVCGHTGWEETEQLVIDVHGGGGSKYRFFHLKNLIGGCSIPKNPIRCYPPRETQISLNNRVSPGNGALQVKNEIKLAFFRELKSQPRGFRVFWNEQ